MTATVLGVFQGLCTFTTFTTESLCLLNTLQQLKGGGRRRFWGARLEVERVLSSRSPRSLNIGVTCVWSQFSSVNWGRRPTSRCDCRGNGRCWCTGGPVLPGVLFPPGLDTVGDRLLAVRETVRHRDGPAPQAGRLAGIRRRVKARDSQKPGNRPFDLGQPALVSEPPMRELLNPGRIGSEAEARSRR